MPARLKIKRKERREGARKDVGMGSHFSLASALVHQLEPDSCAADKAESFNSALSSEYCSAIRILL